MAQILELDTNDPYDKVTKDPLPVREYRVRQLFDKERMRSSQPTPATDTNQANPANPGPKSPSLQSNQLLDHLL